MIRLFSFPRILFLILFSSLPSQLGAATAVALNSPSQAAVNAAIACPLISYGSWYNGGAYTNGAWFGGASITLAVASYAGNTTADARLLQQIRHTLTAGNEPCANGGYPAQHERHVTGMFAIVRQTPRIWDQLSAAEKSKIDLVMKATFVASAFTTSNNNPYVLAGSQQYSLDGDSNLNRDWNPNYREGMLGGVLVGMVYFGGPVAADAVLKNYSHAQFVAQLSSNGLPNTYQVFNWKAANPSLPAPTGSQIESAVRNYRCYNSGLAEYSALYVSLVNDTYGKNVNAGLNDGAGINGAGKIYAGAAGLPNLGAPGMLKEFDSIDGGGNRSSLLYAWDGYRPHQTNQLVMIIGGFWQKGSAIADAAVARQKIGNTDLFYKLSQGYIDYSSGKNRGTVTATYMEGHGTAYVRSLWDDVLKPYHESAVVVPDADTDGDGVSDSIELLLGLDPANSESKFSAKFTAGTLEWPSAVGLSFTVERSSSETGIVWETIATIPGTASVATFVDPNPPARRALYRVGLIP
jgi:hypothetical protein